MVERFLHASNSGTKFVWELNLSKSNLFVFKKFQIQIAKRLAIILWDSSLKPKFEWELNLQDFRSLFSCFCKLSLFCKHWESQIEIKTAATLKKTFRKESNVGTELNCLKFLFIPTLTSDYVKISFVGLELRNKLKSRRLCSFFDSKFGRV